MRLETGVRQPAARRVYEREGDRRIPAFPPRENDPESGCSAEDLARHANGRSNAS